MTHLQPGEPRTCPGISAAVLDAAVGEQVLRALTPAGIELSLTAAGDIERERARLDAHWRAELERAGYEARLAERSYRAVDPDNRLVARTLEQRWEDALRREQEAREGYDRFRRESPRRLTPEELDRIRALAADIPSLWNAADTPAADRKEIVRALIERVTVTMRREHRECRGPHPSGSAGPSTEHALRRPISRYERLADFPRMRRLVEAAVAAGRTCRADRRVPQPGGLPPAIEPRGPIHAGAVPGTWCTDWASARGDGPPRAWRPTNGGSATWRTNSAWATTDSRNGSRRAMSMSDESAAGGIW